MNSATCTAASLALLMVTAFNRSESGKVSRGSSQTTPVRGTASAVLVICTGDSSEIAGFFSSSSNVTSSVIILTIEAIGTLAVEFFSHNTLRVVRSTMMPEVAPALPTT